MRGVKVVYEEEGGEFNKENIKINFIRWVLFYFCFFKANSKKRILLMDFIKATKD